MLAQGRVGFAHFLDSMHCPITSIAFLQNAENRPEDEGSIVMVYLEAATRVDIVIIEFHDCIHELQVLMGKDKALFRRALMTNIRDQRVHDGRVGNSLDRLWQERVQVPFQALQRLPILFQDTQADGILDVPAEIGDLVGNLDDAAFPRIGLEFIGLADRFQGYRLGTGPQGGLAYLAAMADDAVADGVGEHEILRLPCWVEERLDVVYDAQALLFMPEGFTQLIFADVAQHPFAQVAEGRMAQVVAVGDGADELRVQAQVTADSRAHGIDVVHMLDARTDMVVLRRKEDLSLAFQSAVGRTMEDTRKIAAEFRAEIAIPMVQGTTARNSLFPMRMMLVHAF